MEDPNKYKSIPPIQTYAEDMTKAIEDSGGALVRKVIEEEEAHEREKRHPEERKNRFFALGGSVLLLLGLGVVFYFFMNRERAVPLPPPPPPAELPILKADTFIDIDLGERNKDEIREIILEKVSQAPLADKEIGEVRLTKSGDRVELRRFIALAGMNLPLDKLDFVDDKFFLGVISINGAREAFLIIKMREFQDIFPALRDWEKKMYADLRKIFLLGVAPENDYLLSKEFKDGILNNKNARLLEASTGDVAMFYIFANPQSVVISTKPDILDTVLPML